GIAGMGDSAALGRIGAKALAWFIFTSLVSLTLGMVLVDVLRPGAGLSLTAAGPVGDLATQSLTFRHFVLEIFPTSAFDAMATNSVLQILVFSLFTGVALSAIGEEGALLVRGCDALVKLMLQITFYVMRVAPFAVFGAMAAIVAQKGLGILATYGVLVSEFYLGLGLLWVFQLAAGALFLGPRALTLFRYIREPVLISFSTASSEASLPKMFEQLDRFGVPRRVSGFVLPLGYAFNLTGSMMYTSFASLFIAQAYGIQLPLGTQVLMLLTLMVSSKGIAGVPRASLVVIAATLTQFHLPVEGIALLLGVDTFLDMGRSATSVLGNAIGTAVVTRSEGMLQPLLDPDAPHPHMAADTPEHGAHGLHLDPGQ
ncbi:MAG: dicarboxylate/amino acid:cation symporter, partial [Proteobacteria bacterium]|nr:dicarboxylate/amino acid:cation symporter [Pseudomonadota bacterium]